MPFTFVLALICFVAAIVAAVSWRFVKSESAQFGTFLTALVGAALALVFLVCASANIVGTRQIGIVTKFGKPTGETLSNGLHWLAPWKTVNEMDGAIQNDVFNGDKRVSVRLGNNSTAQADVNIRWNIKQDAADELFQQYKSFDNVRSNLIERNLRTALNESFTKFDPLSNDPAKNNLSAIPVVALESLRAKVGDQVEIVDLSVPIIDYDDNTEQRINAINAARAQTTQAEQDALTAVQKRKAAEELAGQPVPDLKIAIAACVNKMAETGSSLNCFPIGGGNVVPTLAIPNPAG